MRGSILIIEDDTDMLQMLEDDLGAAGFETNSFSAADQAFARIRDGDADAILTDMNLPGMNGLEFCERIAANKPDIPVIVITAFGSMDSAIAAMRAGAYDYINKPVESQILFLALDRAVRHRNLQKQIRLLSEKVNNSRLFDTMIGESPAMEELFAKLSRIADTDASVLITGESGTGKELAARAIHNKSSRASGPFVPISCAALPPDLLESELFGHARGAFTDARSERKGLFLQAEGGTLFLDEIGEFPVPLQPKLLRALEERFLRPVGKDTETPFDVRIIAATNRNLEQEIETGNFREDLYYRLNVIQVTTPPLRTRGMDILLLAQHFTEIYAVRTGKEVGGISKEAAERLLSYGWPGNVRELRNAVERGVALTRYREITVEDLPGKLRSYEFPNLPAPVRTDLDKQLSLEEIEKTYIMYTLNRTEGNKTLAARILGIDRKTLYRKLEKMGIDTAG